MKKETLKIKCKDMYRKMTKEELEIHMSERRKGRIGHKSIKDYTRKRKHKNGGGF